MEVALFQTLIATAVDGIMVIDEFGRVEVYNEACERLFGYAADTVLGQNIKMLMPEPYGCEHDLYLEHYRKTGEKKVIGIGREVVGQRKDGSTFPMRLSVGEVHSEGRRVFVGIVNDLSERERRDQRIAELQHELLHVSRLTDMGQLAGALAHELNQPLTAILNYANVSRRMIAGGSDQTARLDDVLQKIAEQAARAGDIIRGLRSFVEKRAHNRSVEDMVATIEEAIALAMVGAADANVKLTRMIDSTLPRAVIDKIQIQQVLVNLVRNAIEAMERSPRREIAIAASTVDDFIVVSVTDTGPGLSPEVAERLFQPFVTTKVKGMGMGLSICLAIIEAHGGRLAATSGEAGGARFEFSIPLHVRQAH
jgi:two-component system sensor kinase FixL